MAQGSIKKHISKDGTVSYRVRVDAGFDPVTGRRKRPLRTFKTRKEAEIGLAQWLLEIERGTAVDPSKMTVAEYLRDWLETEVKPNRRPATYSAYERVVRVQLVPRIGNILLQKLTALQVKQCYARMRTEPRADRRSGVLSNESIRHAHKTLKKALRDACRLHMLDRNVATEVDPPKSVRAKIEFWDREEAHRFLDIADTDPYRVLWHVAMHTGMRKSEVLGLRWCDVDLDRGVLRVRQQRTHVQGVPGEQAQEHMDDPKTDSGMRAITLPPDCVALLRDHYTARPPQPITLDRAQRGHDLVFTTPEGEPVVHDTIGARFDRLVARAGLKRITFHGMRHTHATLLLLANVNIKTVSARLGHANIQITLDAYAHVLPEMEQQAAEAIGAVLRRAS
jgi:integrase